MLDVHPSGFYAWLQQPHSQRHQADLRLTGQIKQFWLESGCVYGYRKIHLDLRDSGQQCGVNRVWRLMKRVGIKAQVGYRSPRARKGEASIVSPNRLQRQFNPDAPDERWVTDITYIMNRPGFPGECFICELRLPDHRFRWKHNKLFLLLPEEYGPAFPAIVDCYTSPPTLVWPVPLLHGFSSSYGVLPPLCKDH